MSEAETILTLDKSPIVEMILDVDCVPQVGRDLADLQEPARQRFSVEYPQMKTVYLDEHQIESPEPDAPPKLSMRRRKQAFRFLTEDKMQLVQVRVDGFSFNRLAPYTTLDDYMPKIEKAWRTYAEIAVPFAVRQIRLRYINRILIPWSDEGVDLDDYLLVAPRTPDDKTMDLTGFLNQYSAIEKSSGHTANVVLTTERSDEDVLRLILDNSVLAAELGDPQDWEWIRGRIQSLRSLARHIFQRSLTDKCLDLFRQPQP